MSFLRQRLLIALTAAALLAFTAPVQATSANEAGGIQ